MSVTYQDILAAARVLDGHIEKTPMRLSRTLSEITGARVWIKFENMQFTAAFKERGALNRLSKLSEAERKAGVIAMSAGNHAQGVAYNAARLGIPATIVMPVATPFVKVEHTRRHGAKVILHGDTLVEASNFAHELGHQKGLTFIHPYDDPDVIAGQGTIGIEMLEAVPELETLIIPVGGGGLIAGVSVAARAIKPGIEVIGVEARLYPALYAARRGEEAIIGGNTIAEGIAVKEFGKLPLAITQTTVDDVVLVEEDHLERAIVLFATVEKTIAEGAGAAGLAALLAHPTRFQGKEVGIVLCGGNIDTRLLASVLTRSLVREKRLASIRIIGDDRPGLLAKVSKIIGDGGGNIVEVSHNRIALDVPAKGAEFDILVETRDAQHMQEIIDALAQAGYPPRNLSAV
jgi:threonine dehydratase